MNRARAFFFVCAGLFLLALSYHLGARRASAQAPGNPIVGISHSFNGASAQQWSVVTANGDVYYNPNGTSWYRLANVFTGTAVQQESWGAVKSRYRGERGATAPGTQAR